MILRARIVAPIHHPPIEDGAVEISADRIVWVGRHGDLPPGGEPAVDLGDAILMPGLVNAHCHLDYTDMAGLISPPRGFTDWIQALVGCKAGWTSKQFAVSWQRGAAMLLRHGTTTVLDVEAAPELLPDAWEHTPLRVFSFRELLHVKNRLSAAELIERAVNDWLGMPSAQGRVGLSPHAPYTTSRELLELASRAAHRRRWRLVTHVAESEEEFQMYMYGQGPMFDWLKNQREMTDCGRGSPVQHLERCGYLDENLIAIHVNYLWRHDAGILSRNGVHVVHCPRSHDYFKHLKFPAAELEGAGVNLCLGTDSLATMRVTAETPLELNMFSEMQTFARQTPEVASAAIVRMATINGARALGRAGDLGELAPNALADLLVLPFAGRPAEVADAIVHHQGPVSAVMIGGNWIIPPSSSKA